MFKGKSKYFVMGQTVMNRNVFVNVMENEAFATGVSIALDRYVVKDWGNIGIDDWDLNNQALLDGTRIFASYQTCKGDIWIITEADRSATTVLFPDEY